MCREKNTFLRYFNRNCVATLDLEVINEYPSSKFICFQAIFIYYTVPVWFTAIEKG